jgi:hypothetical protein
MNFSQAGNGLESRLREDAVGGTDEALRVWTEAAKTKDAALLEREIELRELQETLEQNRRDCQAWEDRLRTLESHLREREEKINEREQALEEALQRWRDVEASAGGDLQPSAHQVCANKVEGILRDITRADRTGVDPGAMPASRTIPQRQESVSPKITSEPSEPRPMDSPSNGIDGINLPQSLTNSQSSRVAGPRQQLAVVPQAAPPPGMNGAAGATGAAAGGADGWMAPASALASRMKARGPPLVANNTAAAVVLEQIMEKLRSVVSQDDPKTLYHKIKQIGRG